MEWLSQLTVGELIMSFLLCCVIHEFLVAILPDTVAGPGGWLIDTGSET
ncbi:hypothetical protein [Tropicimonas isoalkanivorans]|uniref:Uncharacterized protein n=1 Tax=Tropicimonas isoalkanivorans TaxID=441112 RepID=A0A1I1PC04_9RHOB|nr:hypothetical protein [Tropicimonas isoalkanivorans]SFD05168.1 hypothetical protein SAMN04488094_11411 [Tropicimonas isoalkanivorans]